MTDAECLARAEVVFRRQVMWLIEQEIKLWGDTDPPRHALSVLWGKIRDMDGADECAKSAYDLADQIEDGKVSLGAPAALRMLATIFETSAERP